MLKPSPADSPAREKDLLSLVALLIEDVTQAEADADRLDAEIDRLDVTVQVMADGLTDPRAIAQQVEKTLADKTSDGRELDDAVSLQGALLSMRSHARAGDADAMAAYRRYLSARRKDRTGSRDHDGNAMTARQARLAALQGR